MSKGIRVCIGWVLVVNIVFCYLDFYLRKGLFFGFGE